MFILGKKRDSSLFGWPVKELTLCCWRQKSAEKSSGESHLLIAIN